MNPPHRPDNFAQVLDETTVLRGTVEQVVFTNPDSGWTVLKLQVPDETAIVTVVGVIAPPSAGGEIEVTGGWQHTSKYGRQFKAESALTITPNTAAGIQAYLGSGVVDGVGKSLAERLVARFGDETLAIIERSPERLTEVEGIGQVRAARIQEALADQLHLQSTMVFLHGLGVAPGLAARIHRRYGGRTVEVVRTEPFRLALDVRGVGFYTADGIAAKLGVAKDSPDRAMAALLHALAEAAQDGHVFQDRDRLGDRMTALLGHPPQMDPLLDALSAQARITTPADAQHAVYAASLYEAESVVCGQLDHLLQRPAAELVSAPHAIADEFEKEAGLRLAEQQRQAIVTANTARVLVITGGPGTGKTTLVRGLLHLFARASLDVELAAPTGRAAKRLAESTGKNARTLHRLLAYDPTKNAFAHGDANPLPADALVVDEVSMVDLPLMQVLAAALSPSVRLVLVGDVDQLPSVGPGQVLKDLIESERFAVVRLDRVFRQGEQSRITDNAHRINKGQMPDLAPPNDGLSDFYLIERDETKAAQQTLLHVVADRIPASFGVDPVDDIQVLAPMHKGELGALALNRSLQERLNPEGPSLRRKDLDFRLGDKVMQTRNDYDLNVFNGDLGRIVHVDEGRNILKVAFDGREVLYEPSQLDALTLAYATSIHKSQGSEYPVVVIPIAMQHFVMLHRNLLYTAVTRGKRLVVLIGSQRAVRTAVERAKDLRRNSRLAERLRS